MNYIKSIILNFKLLGFKKFLKKFAILYLSGFFLKIAKIKKIYLPENNKFNKIKLDMSYYYSELCELSKKFNTDKSPFNKNNFRHAYTPVYHFLFNKIKNKNLIIAEIGILKNESIKLLREYFINSKIYGFDNEIGLLEIAKKDNLKDVFYNKIDIKNSSNINNVFQEIGESFDIIIDDSTHVFEDQIRIIENLNKFLKPGGTIVIEDIYNYYDEKNYFNKLSMFKNLFSEIYFIEIKHRNIFTPLWNNNKILVLEK
ncbi:class I SAM-dependent methyltransferase [Candidatus Pelagibacter sp.]|nr:class I SAM-dependent methyltransferase [Candidatus Pelagibacter sp.]